MAFLSLLLATMLCTDSQVRDDLRAVLDLGEKGKRALNSKQFDEALALYRTALDRLEGCNSRSVERVALEINVSVCYLKLSRFQEAEEAGKRAVADARELLGENGENTLVAIQNLGYLYLRMGQPLAAAGYLNQVFNRLDSKTFTQADRRFENLTGLASAYAMMGQDSRAERLLRDAIELHAHSGLATNRTLGVCINHLALLLSKRGARGDAILEHSRAAEIFRKHGDANDLATALLNAACLQVEERNFQQADDLLDEASRTLLKSGPGETLATAHLHLARTVRYSVGGHTTEAIREVKDALAIYQKILPPAHPDVLDAKTSYALLLRKNGQKKAAKSLESEIASARTESPTEQVRENVVDYRALLNRDK